MLIEVTTPNLFVGSLTIRCADAAELLARGIDATERVNTVPAAIYGLHGSTAAIGVMGDSPDALAFAIAAPKAITGTVHATAAETDRRLTGIVVSTNQIIDLFTCRAPTDTTQASDHTPHVAAKTRQELTR